MLLILSTMHFFLNCTDSSDILSRRFIHVLCLQNTTRKEKSAHCGFLDVQISTFTKRVTFRASCSSYVYKTYRWVVRSAVPPAIKHHLTGWAARSVYVSVIRLLQTLAVMQSQHAARHPPACKKVWEKQKQCKFVADFLFLWWKGTKNFIVTDYFVENVTK